MAKFILKFAYFVYMYLIARNSTLLHANNKSADQPAHPRKQLALKSIIAKHLLHAKNENKKYNSTARHACADPDNSNGGGGIASRGKFVPVFLLKNK